MWFNFISISSARLAPLISVFRVGSGSHDTGSGGHLLRPRPQSPLKWTTNLQVLHSGVKTLRLLLPLRLDPHSPLAEFLAVFSPHLLQQLLPVDKFSGNFLSLLRLLSVGDPIPVPSPGPGSESLLLYTTVNIHRVQTALLSFSFLLLEPPLTEAKRGSDIVTTN